MELKKNNKIVRVMIAGACAAALAVSGVAPAFGAGQESTVDVSYDSTKIIPGTANWGIKVPASVVFTDKLGDIIDASVELVNRDGGKLEDITQLPGDGSGKQKGHVTVKVAMVKPTSKVSLVTDTTPELEIPFQMNWTFKTNTAKGDVDPTYEDRSDGIVGDVTSAYVQVDRTNAVAKGTAKRLAAAPKPGSYAAQLNFTFDDETNVEDPDAA